MNRLSIALFVDFAIAVFVTAVFLIVAFFTLGVFIAVFFVVVVLAVVFAPAFFVCCHSFLKLVYTKDMTRQNNWKESCSGENWSVSAQLKTLTMLPADIIVASFRR